MRDITPPLHSRNPPPPETPRYGPPSVPFTGPPRPGNLPPPPAFRYVPPPQQQQKPTMGAHRTVAKASDPQQPRSSASPSRSSRLWPRRPVSSTSGVSSSGRPGGVGRVLFRAWHWVKSPRHRQFQAQTGTAGSVAPATQPPSSSGKTAGPQLAYLDFDPACLRAGLERLGVDLNGFRVMVIDYVVLAPRGTAGTPQGFYKTHPSPAQQNPLKGCSVFNTDDRNNNLRQGKATSPNQTSQRRLGKQTKQMQVELVMIDLADWVSLPVRRPRSRGLCSRRRLAMKPGEPSVTFRLQSDGKLWQVSEIYVKLFQSEDEVYLDDC